MPKFTGTYRVLNRQVGRALVEYRMLDEGDRILVGVSGGKDSAALLWSLVERQGRSPVGYDLYPVHIDPGFESGCADHLRARCRDLGLTLRVVNTAAGRLAHDRTNRENPCFLCARLRRKQLFDIARETGCRKIALGHNKDDIIETFFLNICYAGAINTMRPAQPVFAGRVTVIRPLAFVEEDLVRRFVREKGLAVFRNPCPSARRTKRQEIKELLLQLYRRNPNIKGNVFHALHHLPPDDQPH
ncbi:MAG: ATP-binding protein [Desulfobacterales bacterium]